MDRPSSRPSLHDAERAKVTGQGVPTSPGIAARLFRELADADVTST
jgi:hypothetical protein